MRSSWDPIEARRRVRRRYAADRRLQAYGIIAIALAVGLLGVLVTSLVMHGLPRFHPDQGRLAGLYRSGQGRPPGSGLTANIGRWSATPSTRPSPAFADDQKRSIGKILTSDAAYIVRDYVVDHPDVIGKTITLPIAVSDPFDQLYKGVIPKEMDALNWSQVALVRAAARIGGWWSSMTGARASSSTSMSIPRSVEAGPPPSGDFAVLARK